MSLSNFIENKVLDHILTSSTTPFVTTTTVWASLHTADPGETGTASPLASCPRFIVHFGPATSATSFNDTAASVVSNAVGTVTHMAFWDGSSTATANCLGSASMTSGGVRMAAAGSTFTLASAVVFFSMD